MGALALNDRDHQVCHRIFPSRFIWAAHIKKRSACSNAERNRLQDIAMAACTFGCDQLYEEGYLTVGPDGTVLVSAELVKADGPLADYARQFVDSPRRCLAWIDNRAHRLALFEWHRNKIFRR